MTHGREKSGHVVVAGKRANKAERSAAEPVERRAGAEGNACQSRAPGAEPVQRVTGAGAHTAGVKERLAVTHPRWEPYAGKPHVRICAGGAQ